MANESPRRRRTQPVRITHMTIAPGDPRRLEDAPLVITAKLDPGPDQEEHQWWMEQLRERVTIRSWSASPDRVTAVNIEAPPDQVEAIARRLLTAVDEANAAYPERYPAWRRAHDDRIAEERLREQRRLAAHQAILDRVMEEHRPHQQPEPA